MFLSRVYYCTFIVIFHGVVLGVNLPDIVPKTTVRLKDLSGKSIAIGTYNTLPVSHNSSVEQGTSLKDSSGKGT